MRKRTEADGKYFTFEVYCAYMSIMHLADGFERAGSTDKDAVNAALASSTLEVDFMPYDKTEMVNGQNIARAPWQSVPERRLPYCRAVRLCVRKSGLPARLVAERNKIGNRVR